MSAPLDWTTDPIVLLEKLIEPVLSSAPEALAALALYQMAPEKSGPLDPYLAEVDTTFRQAEEQLANGGATYLAEVDVHLDEKALAICQTAARTLHELRQELTGMLKAQGAPHVQMTECATMLRTRARPHVSAALDALRATFINHVLSRNTQVSSRAEEAIQQLSIVSKKIFYISLNASVEAARVGDAGRGFSFISQEIRTLSQDAQAATANLVVAMGRAN